MLGTFVYVATLSYNEQEMADGSDENSLPPFGYGYHHPYYGHLYTRSLPGVAYPTWPQSHPRKRKDDCMPLSYASAGDCRTSSRKQNEDLTYSYLVKIIPPNNKKRATVHEMYNIQRRFESPDALKAQIMDSLGDKIVRTTDSFQIGYFDGRRVVLSAGA